MSAKVWYSSLPCSSTKPMSWRFLWQSACEQQKQPGHHVFPTAVMNGPLK